MSIVTRPVSENEPDILTGREFQSLIIKDLNDSMVKTIKADASGWTHDKLESIDYFEYSQFGWNAYLADEWIGSSEV